MRVIVLDGEYLDAIGLLILYTTHNLYHNKFYLQDTHNTGNYITQNNKNKWFFIQINMFTSWVFMQNVMYTGWFKKAPKKLGEVIIIINDNP